MQISFQTPNHCFNVTFNSGAVAKKILDYLPIDSKISIWGDEIYFKTDIEVSCEELTSEVSVGDVAYWPQGRCICVFFGRTPMSNGLNPVPASPVVIIGKAELSLEGMKKIQPEDSIRVMQVEHEMKKEDDPLDDFAIKMPSDPNRKLTQAEIDDLVQRLLAAKKRHEENK